MGIIKPQGNDKHAAQIIQLFDSLFTDKLRTRLCGGGAEPLYLPATNLGEFSRIIFTQDYFSSALHEIAHWCVAGEARRKLVDFGYWYAPDGRSQQQQSEFERVEVKPQALEWIFSIACAIEFRVSADNLSLGLGPSQVFKNAIAAQAQAYCALGLPERPLQLAQALGDFYGVSDFLSPERYCAVFLN